MPAYSEILYEDNHIIAVNKKPSDLVQGDKTGDTPLSELIKEWLVQKYNKPGEAFLGVVHRIDRPVSGVVMFAKTGKALSRMNQLFQSKEVKKTYWAVVKNQPKKESDKLTDYLIRNQKQNKSFCTKSTNKDAKKSELNYTVLKASDKYFLLEINPLTGRHHQIRVQLSNMGCPIKGDLKYGFDRSNPDGSIHLHARKIEFIHPVKNEKIEITAPTPDEVLWNFFTKK